MWKGQLQDGIGVVGEDLGKPRKLVDGRDQRGQSPAYSGTEERCTCVWEWGGEHHAPGDGQSTAPVKKKGWRCRSKDSPVPKA